MGPTLNPDSSHPKILTFITAAQTPFANKVTHAQVPCGVKTWAHLLGGARFNALRKGAASPAPPQPASWTPDGRDRELLAGPTQGHGPDTADRGASPGMGAARFEQRPKPVWEGGGKKKQLSWPSPRGPCHLPSPIRPPVLHPCPRGPRAFALAHSAWSVLAPDLHRRAPLNPKASSLPPAKAPSHSPCLGASYQQTKPSSS